jgi:hypothetical protein
MFGGYDGERDGGFGKSLCDRARLKNCLGEQWDQPIPAALGSNLQLNYAPFVVSVEEKTGARISGGEMPADSPASLSEGVRENLFELDQACTANRDRHLSSSWADSDHGHVV